MRIVLHDAYVDGNSNGRMSRRPSWEGISSPRRGGSYRDTIADAGLGAVRTGSVALTRISVARRSVARNVGEEQPMRVQDLDTPCAVVDLDVMENNLRRCQAYLDRHGLNLRPHIKTHKIPEFAHLQIRLGAKGVNCQKLGEAEVMIEAGITDVLLTYNIIGQAKLDRLVALSRRADMKVVADSTDVVEGLSSAMSRAGLNLPVLVECDTGAHRCGVTSPAEAAVLAQTIDRANGLEFRGLMTYPPKKSAAKTNAWLAEAVDLCKRSGLSVGVVSNGGTPDLYSAHEVTVATEHRAGTYVYSDRHHVETHGFDEWADCALRVQARVVSHAAPERCVIDAGSKSLSSDLLGLQGYGRIVEHPDWEIVGLSEEHGHVSVPKGAARPKVGELVSVIPNHVCVVTNLHDGIYAARQDRVETFYPVSARGKVQ
jgi:D-serine deaminase-like pyridoxal phosphate-dependent protein